MISDAFIEAVAAIVLQTAVRRFLGIQQAKRLRSERNQQVAPTSVRRSLSPSPTQTEGSLSQRAVASQGNRSEQQESQGQSRTTSMQTVASENQSDGMSMGQEGFFYHLAAIQIQSVFRGWWVRDSMNVDH